MLAEKFQLNSVAKRSGIGASLVEPERGRDFIPLSVQRRNGSDFGQGNNKAAKAGAERETRFGHSRLAAKPFAAHAVNPFEPRSALTWIKWSCGSNRQTSLERLGRFAP
jgi:hypothetical protein